MPAAGIYYLSASLTLKVAGGDSVSCIFDPDPTVGSLQQVDPGGGDALVSMSLNGAISLNAGQSVKIDCFNAKKNASTRLASGNLNGTLISNSKTGVTV